MITKREKCLACGEPIVFATYRENQFSREKHIACNPEHYKGSCPGVQRIVTVDGKYRRNAQACDYGYQPHWLTCTSEKAEGIREEVAEKNEKYLIEKRERNAKKNR